MIFQNFADYLDGLSDFKDDQPKIYDGLGAYHTEVKGNIILLILKSVDPDQKRKSRNSRQALKLGVF